jgi:hypothetical protein
MINSYSQEELDIIYYNDHRDKNNNLNFKQGDVVWLTVPNYDHYIRMCEKVGFEIFKKFADHTISYFGGYNGIGIFDGFVMGSQNYDFLFPYAFKLHKDFALFDFPERACRGIFALNGLWVKHKISKK